MGDVKFDYQWVAGTNAARIQRAAVMYPLTGPAKSPAAIVDRAERLRRWWRTRVIVLMNAGWCVCSDRLRMGYMRNCFPTFVAATPQTRACRERGICPFCYARWVRDVWCKINVGLSGTIIAPYNSPETGRSVGIGQMRDIVLGGESPRRKNTGYPVQLVEVSVTRYIAYTRDSGGEADVLRALLHQVVSNRAKRVRRIAASGSFVVNTVMPTSRGWCFRRRELHVLRGEQCKVPSKTPGAVCRNRLHASPTRATLFQAVARACSYPRGLMCGDPVKTVTLLHAKRGDRPLRLSAFYGCFRKQRERIIHE